MRKIVSILVALTLVISCSNEDGLSKNCQLSTIISAEEYKNAPSDNLTVSNMEIMDDCLTISFSSGGCDGKSWEYKLIDSNNIEFLVTTDESSTGSLAQRTLRISLKNDEDCEAIITKTTSFNISNLRVEGENSVELNIANDISSVIYKY